jgi:hypothetical protein
MRLVKTIVYSLAMLVTLLSCGGTTHSLLSGKFSNNESFKINSYYGCCGCSAKYFVIYSGSRMMEQVIYSYNCYAIGKPTKFVFNYNDNGKLVSCDKYVATTSEDFTQKLSEHESQLFSRLDTTVPPKINSTVTTFSEIKGFRKPMDDEVSHSFPLIKKGYKLPIN